jgi:hypothetical protein
MFKNKYIFLSHVDSYIYGTVVDEGEGGSILFDSFICKHPPAKHLINIHDYTNALLFDTAQELMAYVEWLESPREQLNDIHFCEMKRH